VVFALMHSHVSTYANDASDVQLSSRAPSRTSDLAKNPRVRRRRATRMIGPSSRLEGDLSANTV
jgi:hypothetical protein